MCRVWWTRGQRPPGLCDNRFTFAYIFACVEPGTDNAFALVLPYVNTEAMQVFLDHFAKTVNAYLGLPKATLVEWRAERRKGFGPKVIRKGGYVRYRIADLDLWLAANVEAV